MPPMEEIFDCELWVDASALIASGFVAASGGRAPDFVCTFKDGSLVISTTIPGRSRRGAP